jgi:hypothetical protein
MPKFSARSLIALLDPEHNAGRVARRVKIVVACEASDGTWCEFDADDEAHARILAENAVEKLGARGCSCWHVEPDGSYRRGPSFHTYFWQPEAA